MCSLLRRSDKRWHEQVLTGWWRIDALGLLVLRFLPGTLTLHPCVDHDHVVVNCGASQTRYHATHARPQHRSHPMKQCGHSLNTNTKQCATCNEISPSSCQMSFSHPFSSPWLSKARTALGHDHAHMQTDLINHHHADSQRSVKNVIDHPFFT